MKNKTYLIGIIGIIVVVIGVLLFTIGRDTSTTENDSAQHRGIEGDPTDVMLDFYDVWLERRQSTSTTASTTDPVESMALSYEMQERLSGFNYSPDNTELDPVLCQTFVPEDLRSRSVFEDESSAQRLVWPLESEAPGQATVTLENNDGLWEITDITCVGREQALNPGEFAFDNEGYLLKDSLPESFNEDTWYLVFEENNTPGHSAPLMIDAESMCIDQSGIESTCDQNSFSEAMHVRVQGGMSEAGVEVARIEVLQ